MTRSTPDGTGLRPGLALVTGGAQGIGRGIALALAASGRPVVILDLPQQAAAGRAVAAECSKAAGGGATTSIFVPCDATDRESLSAAMDTGERHFNQPYQTAVATIGGSPSKFARGMLLDEHHDAWRGTIKMTFLSAYELLTLMGRRMAKSAATPNRSICLIGSIMADWSEPGAAAYTTSKAAVRQLGKTAAVELGPLGVRVNVVQPGYVDTPGERRVASQSDMDRAAQALPLRRLGTPDDIGRVVAFLASDQASYVTGSTLTVDGGYVAALRLPIPPAAGAAAAERSRL